MKKDAQRRHTLSEPPFRPSFADLLSPISEEEFFREYYDRKPLHIPGPLEKLRPVLTWSGLTELLDRTAIWTDRTLRLMRDREPIPPLAYCVEAVDGGGAPVLRPEAARVMAWLRDGASLILNDIDTLMPALAAVADALEQALNGKAQANLYCSSARRQAFFSQYDTHDVYALHLEGEKTWRLYENRMPHPVRHRDFLSSGADFDRRHRGAVALEVVLRPGDVLYLPRGWYHDALAASDGALHIAFGVTALTGLDALELLSAAAVREQAFRRPLPRVADGRPALAVALAALADRLAILAREATVIDAIRAHLRENRYARGGFSLPVAAVSPAFRSTGPDFRIEVRAGRAVLIGPGGVVPIPAGLEDAVRWILAHRVFTRDAFMSAFATLGVDVLDKALADLEAIRAIVPTSRA